MSELHGAAVTDENGQQLNNDELADLLSTEDKVEFWFEKLRRGKIVARAKITIDVDDARVESSHIGQYRRDVAANSVAQQTLREEAIQLGLLDDEGKDTGKQSPEKTRLQAKLADLNEEFTKIVATLVANLVVSEPIAGKNLSDPNVLCERDGIGPVAREALYEHFFGDFAEPEVETGTSETPNTENASDTSEAMETEAIVPATS